MALPILTGIAVARAAATAVKTFGKIFDEVNNTSISKGSGSGPGPAQQLLQRASRAAARKPVATPAPNPDNESPGDCTENGKPYPYNNFGPGR